MILSLWAVLRAAVARRPPPAGRDKLLVVVEGKHDVEFLRRISRILHGHDSRLPDLWELEQQGRIVFVPFGGGDVLGWTDRLARLCQSEFHLYDREMAPETAVRVRAAAIVNARPNCRAFVTRKRSLENYLSPRAVYEARGIELRIADDDPIADLAARRDWSIRGREPPWESLPARARKRLRERAKRWLNTDAAERMTVERIDQRDPQGEIRLWLRTIARLVR